MEYEIQKIQDKLNNKKLSSKSAQTEVAGEDIDSYYDKIDHLQDNLERVVKENNKLENIIDAKNQKEIMSSKKHVKSTTSLAYSVDDEQEHYEAKTPKIEHWNNSPTFCADYKENIDMNSSVHTNADGIFSYRNKNEFANMGESALKTKASEQQVLIIDQRRQIEEHQKVKMSLENKIKFETKDMNHIINSLEQEIDGLKQMNSKLKYNEVGSSQNKENIDHYIEQLELNELSLKNELNELSTNQQYYKNENGELIHHNSELQEQLLTLKNKLKLHDLNIDEESTLNILSLKISTQKKEIRNLKGTVEKLKDKYESLLIQMNQRAMMNPDLMNSQLSCSLGLSRGPTHIESLVNNIKIHDLDAQNNFSPSVKSNRALHAKDLDSDRR
jgi:hypothetical protein